MMNDQDRELIAELAQGELSQKEADAAFARVAADPELSLEFEEQMATLAILHSAETPTMTPDERMLLRRGLVDQLGLVADAPVAVVATRKIPWWQPALAAATALGVVAALVILPNQSNDSSDVAFAPASEERSSDTGVTTVTSAASDSAANVENSEEPPAGSLSADGSSSDELLLFEADSLGVDELLGQVRGATTDDEVSAKLSDAGLSSAAYAGTIDLSACLEDIRSQLSPTPKTLLPLAFDRADGSVAGLAHVGVDSGDGIQSVISVDIATCRIVPSK